MFDDNSAPINDPLILPFLSAKDSELANEYLNSLFEETITPQIQKSLAKHTTFLPEEIEEINSDVHTQTLEKLQKLHASFALQNSDSKPIKHLLAYISTITENARVSFILRKHPEWRRIKYRLTRLKDEEDSLLIFSEDSDFIRLKGKPEIHSQFKVEEIVVRVRNKKPNCLFLKTQELVQIILEIANGALTKNELIKSILEITESNHFEEIEMPEEIEDYIQQIDNDFLLTQRQERFLHKIWDEIKKIPPHQRKVLLLSMKESFGVEAISLILKKRIASIKEVAETLEVSLEKFSDIFAKLPMSSSEIADFLGVVGTEKTSKEQKIDNLRRIARDLLRRRLGIKK